MALFGFNIPCVWGGGGDILTNCQEIWQKWPWLNSTSLSDFHHLRLILNVKWNLSIKDFKNITRLLHNLTSCVWKRPVVTDRTRRVDWTRNPSMASVKSLLCPNNSSKTSNLQVGPQAMCCESNPYRTPDPITLNKGQDETLDVLNETDSLTLEDFPGVFGICLLTLMNK